MIGEETAMMGVLAVRGVMLMIIMEISEFNERLLLTQFCKQIDEVVKEMFGKGQLEAEFDDAVTTALKKKEITTKME